MYFLMKELCDEEFVFNDHYMLKLEMQELQVVTKCRKWIANGKLSLSVSLELSLRKGGNAYGGPFWRD